MKINVKPLKICIHAIKLCSQQKLPTISTKKKLTYGNARLAQKPLYKSISNTFLPSTEHYKGGGTNAVSFIRNELL